MKAGDFVNLFHKEIMNNIVFADPENKEKSIEYYYWYLKQKDIAKMCESIHTCQSIAMLTMKFLKEQGIKSDYIFLYHQPYKQLFLKEHLLFNETYLSLIENNKYKETDTFTKGCFTAQQVKSGKTKRFTHGVIEIKANKEKWIFDPTAGLLYTTGKENLLRGNGIYQSFHAFNQIQYLQKSIHYGLATLYYTSEMFWKGVYHLSYDTNGGLDNDVKNENKIIF